MRDWIKVEHRLPEKGRKVLVWCGKGIDRFDIAAVGEDGAWTGFTGSVTPDWWTSLPEPPSQFKDAAPASDIRGEVIDGRLVLDISEDKESVAELMQCFINGEAVSINGKSYLVMDIKNEIIGGKVISIFTMRTVST